MAKVPVGDFGFKVQPLAPTPSVGPASVIDSSLGTVAHGVDEAAGSVVQSELRQGHYEDQQRRELLAEQKHAEAQRQAEDKRILSESKRAEAATIHATAVNDLSALHDEIANGVTSGTIKKEDAPTLWAEKSKALVDGHLGRVDKSNVELVKSNLITPVGTLGRNLNQVVVKRAQQEIGTNLDATLEQLQRSAVKDPQGSYRAAAAALDSFGPQAGLNPEQIGKQKQAFKEGAAYNSAIEKLNGARTSYAGLTNLLGQVQANADLDPGKKNALINSIQGQQLHLQNVAEAAERRRMAGAERAIGVVEKTITAGLAVDPKTWATVQGATKGTPYAPLVDNLMKSERDTQTLLAKPIPEQIAAVNAAEAAAMTGGGLQAKANADRLKKTVGQNIQTLTQTPLVYAVQRQGADGTPLDLTNITKWGDVLQNRLNAVDPLAKQHGVPKRLLYPQEAQALAQTLQTAPTQEAARIFNQLKVAIPDPKAYRDTIAQIAPDDPVTAYAGGLFGKTKAAVREGVFTNSAAPDPQIVARTLLEGQRVLRPSKADKAQDGSGKGAMKMPADKEFDAEFESATRGIYAGNAEARSFDYQAARAYYAGKAAQQGKFDGVIDSSLAREAVTAVTGGISSKYGPVVRPYGWSEDQFRDSVQKGWRQTVADQGLPVTLKDARIKLRNGPKEGAYYVMDGTKFLSGKDGRPIMLDVAP